MPRLMDRYNEHPLSLARNRDNCVICHVHADGSGPLTTFGERYDRVGLDFTPELIRAFPNLFAAPGDGGAGAVGPVPPAAAGPAGNPVVPGNEPFDPAVYYKKECSKCHGKYGDGDPMQGVPAFATKKWIDERSDRTEELLHIILKGKDKMVGQEGRINEEQARQLLEIIRGIATQYS
jgi:mono/diheme cytochrome c family protein